LATNQLEVFTASTSPSPPVSTAQHVLDDHCCKTHFSKLMHATSDPVDQARLLASCSPGSGDWLHALPISSVDGLKWTTPQFEYLQVSVSEHQLFARTSSYVCGTTVTADGHCHDSACSGRLSRHDQINDLLCRARFLLVSLIHCVPQNVPMVLHYRNVDIVGMGCYLSRHLCKYATLSLVLTSLLLPSRPREFGGVQALEWVAYIGRRLASTTHEPRVQ